MDGAKKRVTEAAEAAKAATVSESEAETYWRYAILLLLCLSLLVGPYINWKTKVMVRTRKTVSVVSKGIVQVNKAHQLPNLTQAGIYGSNDMDTHIETSCADENW